MTVLSRLPIMQRRGPAPLLRSSRRFCKQRQAPQHLDDYGRGEYDPETGLYEWYDVPDSDLPRLTGNGPRMPDWVDLFEAWELVEVDLHQQFGLDLDSMPDRDWRWLRARIRGLLHDPSTRTHRATVKPRR